MAEARSRGRGPGHGRRNFIPACENICESAEQLDWPGQGGAPTHPDHGLFFCFFCCGRRRSPGKRCFFFFHLLRTMACSLLQCNWEQQTNIALPRSPRAMRNKVNVAMARTPEITGSRRGRSATGGCAQVGKILFPGLVFSWTMTHPRCSSDAMAVAERVCGKRGQRLNKKKKKTTITKKKKKKKPKKTPPPSIRRRGPCPRSWPAIGRLALTNIMERLVREGASIWNFSWKQACAIFHGLRRARVPADERARASHRESQAFVACVHSHCRWIFIHNPTPPSWAGVFFVLWVPDLRELWRGRARASFRPKCAATIKLAGPQSGLHAEIAVIEDFRNRHPCDKKPDQSRGTDQAVLHGRGRKGDWDEQCAGCAGTAPPQSVGAIGVGGG